MNADPFHLTIVDVGSTLRVHRLTGRETLSRAWHFDVIASGPADYEVERIALGQQATLILQPGNKRRAFYGVVAGIAVEEAHRIDREIQYRFRIVPRLWLLKQKKRTRIFQGQRVPDIASAVLAEAGITTRWSLVRSYPAREYCTQYEETDYEFVRRILAEAGIFFFFFAGAPLDAAALGWRAVASTASETVAALGLSDPASQAAALLAAPLIPGDTIVGADHAAAYPDVAGDDPAALAATTAAYLTAGVLGGISDVPGAAIAPVSSVVSTVLDTARGQSALTLRYMVNDGDAVATYDKVTAFSLQNRVRPKRGTFRDYDPARPDVFLESAAVSTAPFPPSAVEEVAALAAVAQNAAVAVAVATGSAVIADGSAAVADAIAATEAIAGGGGASVPFEVYHHHSPFLFPKWTTAGDEAPLLLRQSRRRASTAHGEGACSDLSPGHRFELSDHAVAHLDGSYAATEVHHHGQTEPAVRQPRIYFNTFDCVPASVPYVPKRPPRRSTQVALTAVVVGPAGDDIFVDSMGRIKVQFHWDRDGRLDGRSSCWIRTLQAWAGASWGHQFIPRVGMEVAVVFEGGDPDKPMVLGALNNATHPPPFALPGEKSRSGIRTRTSPTGDGFNELSFEDAIGREEVFLRAEKDLREEVMHDRVTTVGMTQSTTIGGDLIEQIKGDRHSHVKGVHYDFAKNNRLTSVSGTYSVAVKGELSFVVGTNNKPRASELFTHGTTVVGGSDAVILRSEKRVRLEVGTSFIELSPEGIRIGGDAVTLDGRDSATIRGNGPALSLSDEASLTSKSVQIFSQNASVLLDDMARIDGKKILLNSPGIPPNASRARENPRTKKLELLLTDAEFKPLANKAYVLTAAGAKFEGTTEGNGSLKLDVPEEAQTASLIIFESRPEGPQLRYRIQLAELPGPDTIEGAKARLQNLGYFWGALDDRLDPFAQEALRDFERDHGSEVTGELSDSVREMLSKVAKV